jgi:hypothetical protein
MSSSGLTSKSLLERRVCKAVLKKLKKSAEKKNRKRGKGEKRRSRQKKSKKTRESHADFLFLIGDTT